MSDTNFIADDEITPRTDEEWAEHVATKKLLAQAALDGTWMGKTDVQIDNEIEKVLVEAGVSVLNDEDVVAYLNERTAARVLTPEFKAYAQACRDEAIADTISFMQGIKRGRETLKKFYEQK